MNSSTIGAVRSCQLCVDCFADESGGFFWHYECGHNRDCCAVCALKLLNLMGDRKCPTCIKESSVGVLTRKPVEECSKSINMKELYHLKQEEGEGSWFTTGGGGGSSQCVKVEGLIDEHSLLS